MNPTASDIKSPASVSRLRCINCGAVADRADQDFRCTNCGDLFEVVYPDWNKDHGLAAGRQPDALRQLWRDRKTSFAPVDTSGVWRFRELLPSLKSGYEPITLREGNTPLYDLPRCARSAGVQFLQAKHQGMNPTASFKDTGMTTASSFARQEGFRWVACASTGTLCVDGGLRCTRRHAQPRAHS